MLFNKVFYLNLIVWLVISNVLSIGLVEDRYQKTVIPSIVEKYNDQISLMKEELQKGKSRKEEPEKLICFSETDIIKLLVNNTDQGNALLAPK